MIRRSLILFLVLAAPAAGVGAAAPPAAAADSPCWKRLINDWYDGRIDGAYPVHCYREAIRNLPEDVDAYTEAREDINRALLAAIRNSESGSLDPGDVVPPEPPREPPAQGGGGGGGQTPAETGVDDGDGAPAEPPAETVDVDDETETTAGPVDDDDTGLVGFFRPSNADEIPLPLLVLAGLALLLLAAAAAGFVARRVQARRLGTTSLPNRPAPPDA